MNYETNWMSSAKDKKLMERVHDNFQVPEQVSGFGIPKP